MLQGVLLTIFSYLIWGFAPFFWKWASHISPFLLIYHRIIVSFLLLLPLVYLYLNREKIFYIKRNLHILLLTSILISLNWFIFVWAIVNNRIIETSLGYYLNPFINLAIGIFFLKEDLSIRQKQAVALAFVGVCLFAIQVGYLPWVSIVLALSFSLYGIIHKQLKLNAMASLFIETSLLLFPFIILIYIHPMTAKVYEVPTNFLWLIGAGIVTILPLLSYIAGVKKIPYSLAGILQFMAPTITFLSAVFYFKEDFGFERWLGFSFIWLAILFYINESFRKRRNDKKHRKTT